MSEDIPSDLRDALAMTRELVDPALQEAVDRLDPLLRRVCAYHLGWVDESGTPVPPGSGGKMLRPALTLLSALACGGEPKRAVPGAVAVELVHNFSLVHDDVMDGDATRRHRPAAWAVFGVPAAILAGDAILTLAVDVLLRAEPEGFGPAATGCLTGAVAELIAGQSADMVFETRNDVTTVEGLAMAAGKTSALLRCSAMIGALAVEAPGRKAALVGGFGEHVGNAFQLVDDLLGIWGDPGTTGKPALADLRSRKKSLPVLAALASPSPEGERLRALYARPEPFTDDELPAVAALVDRAGGRDWAQARADAEIRQAGACLEALDAAPGPAAALSALADYVTRRDR
jgi:geranylgeranyl diphosphate synthase, type I